MPGPDLDLLMTTVGKVASDWSDPEYPRRSDAVTATLAAENTFTEESVAFAVNQQMSVLTTANLRSWINGRHAREAETVGVLNAANLPLVDLQDFLAVVLTGHRYLGSVSSRSPALLRAFVKDVRERYEGLEAAFAGAEEIFLTAGALIATGNDDTMAWAVSQADEHGIGEERRLLRGHRFAVGVLDGREEADDYEKLAEDILLHEGFGCRNVSLLWAPRDLAPDRLLDALAHFRAIFPAHPTTAGRLKMQRAFLAAVDAPHAFGEGLEFLVSRGEPEAQQPGHLRWTEYDSLDDVRDWIGRRRDAIQLVVARPDLSSHLGPGVPVEPPGTAQRPPVDWWPDGRDTVEFLSQL